MTRAACRYLAAAAALAAAPALAADPPWAPLFDGKTLDGWVQKGGRAAYEVKDGTILGTSVADTPNTFLCTARDYGDFVLEYEFLVDEALNSGVQVRSHSNPAYQNGRVHGYQIEIDPDVKRARLWTGGIYDEGRRGWLADLTQNEPARKAFKAAEWNAIRVEARGDSLKTWVNGVPAADLVDSMDLTGFIALQVHGVRDRKDPLHVAWRAIRIQDLGESAWRPLWDGKTLQGFKTTGAWAVSGEALAGTTNKVEAKPAFLILEKPLADFTLRAEYRLAGGGGGVYFRAKAGDGGIAGLQAGLDTAPGSGALIGEDGKGVLARTTTEKAQQAGRPGEWNVLTVSAHGKRVVLHVNDIETASFEDAVVREGFVAFGLDAGQDARLEVRRLDLLEKAQ